MFITILVGGYFSIFLDVAVKGSKILEVWALLFCNPAMSLRLSGLIRSELPTMAILALNLHDVALFCIQAAAALATFSHSLRSSRALCPGIPGLINLS